MRLVDLRMAAFACVALLGVAGCGRAQVSMVGTGFAHSVVPSSVLSWVPAEAQRAAGELLAAVPLPPGAQGIDILPDGLLHHPVDLPSRPGMADLTRAWTVPGTVDAVADYLQAHPPAGMTVLGHTRTEGTDGELRGVTFQRGSLDCPRWLVLSVAEASGHTALRADALAAGNC